MKASRFHCRVWFGGEFEYFSVGDGQSYPEVTQMSTGLEDKNGTEIFEGDIVKSTHGGKHYWLYEISTACAQFGGCLFAMLIEHNLGTTDDGETYTYEVETFDKTHRYYVKSGRFTEVIGNIYDKERK